MTDRQGFPRRVAEHEAVHALLARRFGVAVQEIRVDRPEPGTAGWCSWDAAAWTPAGGPWGGLVLERVATAIGPTLWETWRRRGAYPDPGAGGRSDRQRASAALQAACHDPGARADLYGRAQRRALDILEADHDVVLRIADQLQRHGGWTAERGYGRPEAPAYRRAVRPSVSPLYRGGGIDRAAVRRQLKTDLYRRVQAGELSEAEAVARVLAAG